MYRFFETIRIEDGQPRNMACHAQRVARTLSDFWGTAEWSLDKVLSDAGIPAHGLYKCRVSYGQQGADVEFERYTIRSVNSLKLVEANGIDYAYKYTDRSTLEKLFEQRRGADDVLIVKHGRITDTSFANVAFQDARGNWYTPADCLLKGTMRQSLLDEGRIAEAIIAVEDLRQFRRFKVINAMRDWAIPESEVLNIE